MTPQSAAAALIALILASVVLASCEDGEGASSPALPTNLSDFLETPAAERRLPIDVFALAWDGVAEPRQVVEEPLPQGYEIETIVGGLENPVGLAFLPDGRILVGEAWSGRIRLIRDGELRDVPFASINNVQSGSLELGLIGIAVDPDFETNGFVYAFYVETNAIDEPGRSVIVRFRERLGIGRAATEIAEFPATATDKHNGGGLEFGPDGKLYVTFGDTDRKELVQDLSNVAGKILRLNPDGSAPGDNPFVNEPGADPRVFAYGFRNLFGLAFHDGLPGRIIAPDNGVTEFDELNIVSPGMNYGWPDMLGFSDSEGVENPVWTYFNSVAPAGMQVYRGDVLGEFDGDLFFCGFNRGGALHRVRFSEDFTKVVSDTVIATGCSTSIAQGPDGYLYFLEYNPRKPDEGKLHRIGLAGR